MKKTISLILAALLLASLLTGCGSAEPAAPETTAQPQTMSVDESGKWTGRGGCYKLEITENPKFSGELATLIEQEEVHAWTVTNDLLAARLMRHLISAGYKVPEDAALIGFDGSAFVEVTPSPLTTIVFPSSRIAERCIDLLFEKIESGDMTFHTDPELIKPELHIGESCGCKTSCREVRC